MSLLRSLDPGAMGADTGSPLFLGLMLVATLGGIFSVSAKTISVLLTRLIEDRHLYAETPANVATVIEAARQQGETGHRLPGRARLLAREHRSDWRRATAPHGRGVDGRGRGGRQGIA